MCVCLLIFKQSSSWSWNQGVVKDDPPVPNPQALGLQVCATILSWRWDPGPCACQESTLQLSYIPGQLYALSYQCVWVPRYDRCLSPLHPQTKRWHLVMHFEIWTCPLIHPFPWHHLVETDPTFILTWSYLHCRFLFLLKEERATKAVFPIIEQRLQTEELCLLQRANSPAASYPALQCCDGPECLDTP